MALAGKVLLDLVSRFAVPLQWRHRITQRTLAHPPVQRPGYLRIVLFDRLPPSPRLAYSSFLRRQLTPASEFPDSLQNSWFRKATRFHHPLYAAPPTPERFAPYQPTPLRLIESRQHFPK